MTTVPPQRHIETALSAVICAMLIIWLTSLVVARAQWSESDLQDMLTAASRPVASGAAPAETNIPQFASSVFWLRMNDSGMTNDSSAIGTNAAVTDGGATKPTWVSAAEGAYFDGGDYLYSVRNINNGFTALTYSVWVKLSNHVDYAGILSSRGTSPTAGLLADAAPNRSNPSFYINSTNSSFITGGLETGTWHHIVVTWEYVPGVSSNQIQYLDGVQIGTNASRKDVVLNTGAQSTFLGFDYNVSARKFKGNIDDALIYSKALTSNEVLQLNQLGH